MRDGVQLVADLYLPGREGNPLPGTWCGLLERTPYSRSADYLTRTAEFFARRGYAVLVQDVRGRYDSPGMFDPFGPGEVPDGFDTVAWMVRQPWCNGRVGTIGTSYMACVQASLAMARPPGLAAQFLSQGFANHFEGRLRQGGAARLDIGLVWAMRMAASSPEARALPALQQALHSAERNVNQWLRQVPLRPGQSPLHSVPVYERYVLDVTTRGEPDEFWRQPGRDANAAWDSYPDVPIYLLGSWYDSHSVSTLEAFQELSRRPRQAPVRLIMGPWVHGAEAYGLPHAGEAHFGPEAAIEYDTLRQDFFDQALKGEETGIFEGPSVRIFVMGGGTGTKVANDLDAPPRIHHGGRWRHEHEWPPARTRYTPFYLHGAGKLSPAPPGEPAVSSYRYDPADPVPTVGGQVSSTYGSAMSAGAYDQRLRAELGHLNELPLAARPDVLVFQTEPLAEDVEVTGWLNVHLWVSSSAPDTDFTAKLVDVYPPNPDYPLGVALNLTDGIARARYRNSPSQPAWMEPGQVYPLTIKLPPTSNLFARGHRIRLDISSSNFPRFDRHFNSDEPVGRWRVARVAVNSVHHGPEHPSHIVLPIIPR